MTIQTIWIKTFGRNPIIPEQDETAKLIDKFGCDKVYEIFYEASLLGFRKIKTLVEALDDKGNIKPKESSYNKEGKRSPTLGQGNQEYKKVLEEANKQPKWKPKGVTNEQNRDN